MSEAIDPDARYSVVRRLSYGGMSEVVVAERLGSDGSRDEVVLKRLAPQLEAQPYISMFLSEAAVLSRLDHPNVVRFLGVPVVGESLCIALELVDGASLADLLKRKKDEKRTIPLEVAVYIGLEVLEGLQYVHGARVDGHAINLVHRDVKPANILLSRDGNVKLTDFGISKSQLSTSVTQHGVVKGTPQYSSPEQVNSKPVSAQSDLFSLAVVLAEAICGVAVFQRETLASTLLSVSLADHTPLEELFPENQRELARVLERALAVDPARRYESAFHMALEIRAACPIDDELAKARLSDEVFAICSERDANLRRITGSFPLDPSEFENRPRRRIDPRFVMPQISVSIPSRAELGNLRLRDISKGGMFVETEQPLEFGELLSIQLTTPDGALLIPGLVIHAVKDDPGANGMGIQFGTLDDATKAALERFIAGTVDAAGDDPEMEKLIGPILRHANEGDLYAAIGLPPSAPDFEIAARVRELRASIDGLAAGATRANAARIEQADRAMVRIERQLCHAARRILYDSRAGVRRG